jgi:hypothetical protein
MQEKLDADEVIEHKGLHEKLGRVNKHLEKWDNVAL